MHLLDGQVHHDTHPIPMGNYVSAVGNYVSVNPSDLGNYVSADKGFEFAPLPHRGRADAEQPDGPQCFAPRGQDYHAVHRLPAGAVRLQFSRSGGPSLA